MLETHSQPALAPAVQDEASEARTLIIRPQRHLFDLRLSELWQARDLVQLFV